MTVIVTGAARGIGRAITERLLADGRSVVGVDLDMAPWDDIPPALTILEGDVRREDVLAEACARAGVITGVVACAGISRPGPSAAYPDRDWDDILALNVTAVFRLMRAAEPYAEPGAGFVAISSVTASQGFAGRAAYSASKAGVEGLVRALAAEYAPRIRVNAVSPGFVMTDIARANIALGVISDAAILARTPLARWGAPSDVAGAVAFLLGPESSWITGTVLTVDGGWLSHGMGA